jgi:hypothetical protein
MAALAYELTARGAIDVREAFIDASFARAKKAVVIRSGSWARRIAELR